MKRFIIQTTTGNQWEICPTSYVVDAVSEKVAREEVEKISDEKICHVEEAKPQGGVLFVQSSMVE